MRDDQLNGWSRDNAERMGMPHYGAHYLKRVDANTRQPYKRDEHAVDDGATCPFCGRPATEAHHVVQKGLGGGSRVFVLYTKWGRFVLRSPLFGLCSRCHGEFTYKRADARWVWYGDGYGERDPWEVQWEDGELLSHGYEPNGARLYALGYWLVSIWGKTYKLTRGAVYRMEADDGQ